MSLVNKTHVSEQNLQLQPLDLFKTEHETFHVLTSLILKQLEVLKSSIDSNKPDLKQKTILKGLEHLRENSKKLKDFCFKGFFSPDSDEFQSILNLCDVEANLKASIMDKASKIDRDPIYKEYQSEIHEIDRSLNLASAYVHMKTDLHEKSKSEKTENQDDSNVLKIAEEKLDAFIEAKQESMKKHVEKTNQAIRKQKVIKVAIVAGFVSLLAASAALIGVFTAGVGLVFVAAIAAMGLFPVGMGFKMLKWSKEDLEAISLKQYEQIKKIISYKDNLKDKAFLTYLQNLKSFGSPLVPQENDLATIFTNPQLMIKACEGFVYYKNYKEAEAISSDENKIYALKDRYLLSVENLLEAIKAD